MADVADLQRIIETKFILKDEMNEKLHKLHESLEKLGEQEKHAHEETEKLGEKFEQFGERVEGVQERLLGLAEGFGVALGGKALAEKFIEANSEAEKLQRTLGALISVNYQYGKLDPGANFKRSMATGHEMFEEFEAAAIKTGLSTKSLAESANMLVPGFAKAKVGSKEAIENIVKLGMISRNAGQDLGSTSQALELFLMTGMVQHRSLALQAIGLQAMPDQKGFSAEQRLEAVRKGIERFNVESMKGVTTFDDRVSMLKARLEKIYELGGKAFFEKATKKAEEMAAWLDKNQDYVKKLASEAGDKLGTVLDVAVTALKFAAEHAEALKWALIAIATNKAITSTFDKIGETMEKLEKGSKSVGAFGKDLGLGAKAALIAGAFEVGYAIGTAINGYLEKQPWWNKLWTPGKTDQEKSTDAAGEKVAARGRAIDSEISKLVSDYAEINKTSKMAAVAYYEKYLGAEGRAGLGHGMTAGAGAIHEWALRSGLVMGPFGGPRAIAPSAEVETERAKTKTGDIIFNNARFDVRQEFSQGFDPDRIAVAFGNALTGLGERKLQSGLAPLYGVR